MSHCIPGLEALIMSAITVARYELIYDRERACYFRIVELSGKLIGYFVRPPRRFESSLSLSRCEWSVRSLRFRSHTLNVP